MFLNWLFTAPLYHICCFSFFNTFFCLCFGKMWGGYTYWPYSKFHTICGRICIDQSNYYDHNNIPEFFFESSDKSPIDPCLDDDLDPGCESEASACLAMTSRWQLRERPFNISGSGGLAKLMAKGEILAAFSTSSNVTGWNTK